MKAILVVDPAN